MSHGTTLEITHAGAVASADRDGGRRGSDGGGSVREDDRVEELAQIIKAYNEVTHSLQRSHEALRAEVTRLREELASADAQLQRSKRLAALGEMAAGIAHEIRNPLGAIQLYVEMLGEDLAGEDAAPRSEWVDTVRKIETAVRGLNGIVNDVLNFSREVRPRMQCVTVEAVFQRAVEGYRAGIEQAGVQVLWSVERDAGGSGPLTVQADWELLQQALVNLIRNAVEWMSKEGGSQGDDTNERVLTLCGRREESWTVLTVRDTGPGIADRDVDRIFNPFFTTRSTGTGLGLAIVHRIVDAHGGAISVYNDGGAVFELRLPRGKANPHGQEVPICRGVA